MRLYFNNSIAKLNKSLLIQFKYLKPIFVHILLAFNKAI